MVLISFNEKGLKCICSGPYRYFRLFAYGPDRMGLCTYTVRPYTHGLATLFSIIIRCCLYLQMVQIKGEHSLYCLKCEVGLLCLVIFSVFDTLEENI